ncbi:MAG: hypothetical protein M1826_000288 [Phylliscum demangeonii]|nr:MAG: hypothetical protein M1826_000288 [Phylliscum demangeonii]
MASGYGLSGGVSRCFPFWQEVLACYVVNTTADDDTGKSKCMPAVEDYYECLHHKKEVSSRVEPPDRGMMTIGKLVRGNWLTRGGLAARVKAIQAAYRRAEAGHPRDEVPPPGAIRKLGLLDTEGDPQSILRIHR